MNKYINTCWRSRGASGWFCRRGQGRLRQQWSGKPESSVNTEALTPSPVAELLSWAVFQDTDYEDSLRMSPTNSTFCDDGIALHLISTILFCRRGGNHWRFLHGTTTYLDLSFRSCPEAVGTKAWGWRPLTARWSWIPCSWIPQGQKISGSNKVFYCCLFALLSPLIEQEMAVRFSPLPGWREWMMKKLWGNVGLLQKLLRTEQKREV